MSFAALQKERSKRQQSSFVSSTVDSNSIKSESIAHPKSESEASLPNSQQPSHKTTGELYAALPPFLEIRTSAVSGRGIWTKSKDDTASRKITAGTRLFAVQPHAHALSTIHLSNTCSACHVVPGNGAAALRRCTRCKVVWYCSEKCQNFDWGVHKHECKSLQFWIKASGGSESDGVTIPGEAVRALARLLWLREKKGVDSVWAQEVDAMQSHREQLPMESQANLTLLAHSLARYITATDNPEPGALTKWGMNSARDLVDLISRFTVNSFTLTNPSLTALGVAVSPLAALINHSCVPNAVVVFPRSSIVNEPGSDPLEVIAIKDIGPGEEVLTSYVDISLPYRLRAKEIQERYMFKCNCLDCSPPAPRTEPDLRSALWCGRPNCRGLAPLPNKPGAPATCMTCGQPPTTDMGEVLDAVRLGEEALEKATRLELVAPDDAFHITSNMVPLLARYLPPTSHPLLALNRLHLSLAISQLAQAVSELGASFSDVSSGNVRLPKKQVDEVCQIGGRSLSAVTSVFPQGHPVRGIAIAELGKLLCVDVDEDASEMEKLAGVPSEPTSTSTLPTTPELPAGSERLKLARSTLLRAREELRRGFGGDGGEVGRQVGETIRNLEKEWQGWRQVVAQH